jgi:hypothetical protein
LFTLVYGLRPDSKDALLTQLRARG